MNIDIIKENLGEMAWIVEVNDDQTDFNVVEGQVVSVIYKYGAANRVVAKVASVTEGQPDRFIRVGPVFIFATRAAAIDFAEEKILERNANLLARIEELRSS